MATPEATFRARVLHVIRLDYPPSKGEVLVFGRPAGPSTGPGHPDLFGVCLGHFLALELKFGAKSAPTPLQIQRIKDLRRAGAYAWVVHSEVSASKAVYQTKRGGPRPMAEDPIDFDDWFKSITTEAAATPAAAVPAGLADEVINRDPDPLPEEASFPQPGEPEPGSNWQPEPVLLGTAEMPEGNGALPERSDVVPTLVAAFDHLVDVVKTVGDRVTEVYEAVNRIETLARVSHGRTNDLIAVVNTMAVTLNGILSELGEDGEVPEVPEPTPLDDVLAPEEPVKPKRGRKPRAS